jgi:nucleotide-binding universal stress UspA family protein
MARACGSELLVVHALPPEAPFRAPAVEMAPGVYVDQDALEALDRLAVADLAAEYDVPLERVDIARGPPANVIAETAADRRAALVMGVLRRGDAMIGSTAEGVAMDVPCDVLLLPPPRVASAPRERGTRAMDAPKAIKPRRRRVATF